MCSKGSILFLSIRSVFMRLCFIFLFLMQDRGFSQATRNNHDISAICSYIHEILKFVEWHGSSRNTPCVGVTGSVELAREVVRESDGWFTVRILSDTSDIRQCDALLFLGDSLDTGILHALRKRPILTIGTNDSFCESGGIIEIVEAKNDDLRFEINLTRIEESGLIVDPYFIHLADTIHREAD
ncbi:MAG: YfiR family protein [Fibrobacterota bacterium]